MGRSVGPAARPPYRQGDGPQPACWRQLGRWAVGRAFGCDGWCARPCKAPAGRPRMRNGGGFSGKSSHQARRRPAKLLHRKAGPAGPASIQDLGTGQVLHGWVGTCSGPSRWRCCGLRCWHWFCAGGVRSRAGPGRRGRQRTPQPAACRLCQWPQRPQNPQRRHPGARRTALPRSEKPPPRVCAKPGAGRRPRRRGWRRHAWPAWQRQKRPAPARALQHHPGHRRRLQRCLLHRCPPCHRRGPHRRPLARVSRPRCPPPGRSAQPCRRPCWWWMTRKSCASRPADCWRKTTTAC